MKTYLSAACAAIILSTTAIAGEIPANIKAGIDNPNRKEENIARDGDRNPGKVLKFFGIEEGMTVVDFASGGGYFIEILSGAVGPEGKVHAQNRANPDAAERFNSLREHYKQFGNVSLDITEPGAPLPYEDNSVDVLLLSLIIHHLHYDEAAGDAIPERSAGIYADFKRVLKPGGVFAVIEHKAADGSSRADSASWHRIPEDIMKADVTAAGFVIDGSAEKIHANPDDDEKNVWFDTGLRGKTTRLVHRYKNPG
ncbi:MAG: class I SAM-dependent methyltransferase [Marinicaulis sp.]|nr:class I SAM-dependent methyltransferase [Marinicaulis sp.]